MDTTEEVNLRIEIKNLYMYVYSVLYCIDEASDTWSENQLFKHKDYFIECLEILCKHLGTPYYQAAVEKGIQFYHTNNPNCEVKISELQKSCINNPREFNLNAFYKKALVDLDKKRRLKSDAIKSKKRKKN